MSYDQRIIFCLSLSLPLPPSLPTPPSLPPTISSPSPPPILPSSQVFGVLDLKDFEQTFSAFQKNEQNISPNATLRRRSHLADKARELSVIDSRRAQNCNIVLARLKMSNAEIRKAILSVDQGEKLGKDSLEQLKKFVPTPAEVELLEGHAAGTPISSFATADRFLLEMSR